MFKIYALLSVVSIILTVWCLTEATATAESRMRYLPKGSWLMVILLFPLVGSLAWLAAGRPLVSLPRSVPAPAFSDHDGSGRAVSGDPAQAEDFLKRVRERAEDQRRRYAQQQRKQRELE